MFFLLLLSLSFAAKFSYIFLVILLRQVFPVCGTLEVGESHGILRFLFFSNDPLCYMRGCEYTPEDVK